MAYKLKILGDMELCLLVYSGRVQAKDFDGIRETLEHAPDYSWEFDDIAVLGPDADYSNVVHDVAFQQSIRFVEAFRKTNLKRGKHCAFVCSNDIQVAMSKMFGAYVYCQGVPNIEVGAFASMEAALDWIEKGTKPGRKIDRAEIARVITHMGAGWCLKTVVAA